MNLMNRFVFAGNISLTYLLNWHIYILLLTRFPQCIHFDHKWVIVHDFLLGPFLTMVMQLIGHWKFHLVGATLTFGASLATAFASEYWHVILSFSIIQGKCMHRTKTIIHKLQVFCACNTFCKNFSSPNGCCKILAAFYLTTIYCDPLHRFWLYVLYLDQDFYWRVEMYLKCGNQA